jgi:hypothetical protein
MNSTTKEILRVARITVTAITTKGCVRLFIMAVRLNETMRLWQKPYFVELSHHRETLRTIHANLS